MSTERSVLLQTFLDGASQPMVNSICSMVDEVIKEIMSEHFTIEEAKLIAIEIIQNKPEV